MPTEPPAPLSSAEGAVLYLLRRIARDPGLRWLMLHTQAFGKLCEAEALRTETTVDAVEKKYGVPCQEGSVELVRLRKVKEAAETLIEFIEQDGGKLLFKESSVVLDLRAALSKDGE
jgi:hypothetical protein